VRNAHLDTRATQPIQLQDLEQGAFPVPVIYTVQASTLVIRRQECVTVFTIQPETTVRGVSMVSMETQCLGLQVRLSVKVIFSMGL